MATDMTKLESAAITIAAGVHGTVPKDQLAATAVAIAADVLAECEAYAAAQEAAAKELAGVQSKAVPKADAAPVPKTLKELAADDAAAVRLEAAIKAASDRTASEDALKHAIEAKAKAKAELVAAEKAAKDAEAAEKKKAEDVVKVKPAPQPVANPT